MSSNPFEQLDLPVTLSVGDTHTDGFGRLWTCSFIQDGVKGGQWAYCRVVDKPWLGIIVDSRQNLQAAHFAGMLAVPWDGAVRVGWVLDRTYCQPVTERLKFETPDPGSVRFEHLTEPPKDDLS